MEVRFAARGTEIDAGLKGYMESKMSKLEKFFGKILSSQVVVSFQKGKYNVETTANANGVMLRAEENAQDARRAFDQALKSLERQIKRHNSYLKEKGHFNSDTDFSFSLEGEGGLSAEPEKDDYSYEGSLTVERVKKIPLHPMDAKEAIMQMELVGHSFYMFQNGETGDVNIVYRRKDGKYGQLEPVL
jgi:putative sigma-54 modulation protein